MIKHLRMFCVHFLGVNSKVPEFPNLKACSFYWDLNRPFLSIYPGFFRGTRCVSEFCCAAARQTKRMVSDFSAISKFVCFSPTLCVVLRYKAWQLHFHKTWAVWPTKPACHMDPYGRWVWIQQKKINETSCSWPNQSLQCRVLRSLPEIMGQLLHILTFEADIYQYCWWFSNPKLTTTVWMVLKPCK